MKWIKASERLPENDGYNYHVKVVNPSDENYTYNTTALFNKNKGCFIDSKTDGWGRNYALRVFEWLDEQAPDSSFSLEDMRELHSSVLTIFSSKHIDAEDIEKYFAKHMKQKHNIDINH